jgi:CheY-like chemotaxis protein
MHRPRGDDRIAYTLLDVLVAGKMGEPVTGRRILLVEDDPDSRFELRMLLEDEGYTVVEARDGSSAITLATSLRPDLVVQDLLLPDIPGFQLLEAIRRLHGGDILPVVAVSGFHDRLEEAAQAESVKFSAFLRKPINPARLRDVVRTQLSAPRSHPA